MSVILDANQQLGFAYLVVRSKRKTAAIHVSIKGVEVRIPTHVSDEWANDFVVSKQQWISQKLNEQSHKHRQVPTIAFGHTLLVLGVQTTLSFQTGKSKGWFSHEGELVYQAPSEPNPEQLSELLQGYFKQLAQRYLPNATQQMANRLSKGTRLQKVVFRRTKSKWGHCTSAGVIQYNWLIMGAPKTVIDYLVAHEVSHLVHHNHSPAFWQQVEVLYPGYQPLQAWLKQNSALLSWC